MVFVMDGLDVANGLSRGPFCLAAWALLCSF